MSNRSFRNESLLFSTLMPQPSLSQPLNAELPTLETQMGMLIHVRLVQPSNALVEIRDMLSDGMKTETKFVQERNAPSFMLCVFSGREKKVIGDAGGNKKRESRPRVKSAPVTTSKYDESQLIERRLKHPRNAPIPMLDESSELPEGIVIDVRDMQFKNALTPRLDNDAGNAILSMPLPMKQ